MKRQVQKRLWARRPSTEEIAKRAKVYDSSDLHEKILVAIAKKSDNPIFSDSKWYVSCGDYTVVYPGNALGIDSKFNVKTIPEKPPIILEALAKDNLPQLIGIALSNGSAVHIEFCGDYFTANCIGLTGQTSKVQPFSLAGICKAYNIV